MGRESQEMDYQAQRLTHDVTKLMGIERPEPIRSGFPYLMESRKKTDLENVTREGYKWQNMMDEKVIADSARYRPETEILKELSDRLNSTEETYRAFTMTVNRKCFGLLSDRQLRNMGDMFLTQSGCKYTMIPAVSQDEIIHWHGVITGTRKDMLTAKRLLSRGLGFVTFKSIDDPKKWYDYVTDKHQRTEEFREGNKLMGQVPWTRYAITDKWRKV